MAATAEDWARIRTLWEADPKMSFVDVGNLGGVSRQAARQRAEREEWKKLADQSDLARRAYARADEAEVIRRKAAAAKPPPADSASGQGIELPPADEATTDSTVAELTAVEMRARLLNRHRREWDGVRRIAYDAIRSGNFDRAKLGKITAEAISIIQVGERKAWGFDEKDSGDPVRVVVERKGT